MDSIASAKIKNINISQQFALSSSSFISPTANMAFHLLIFIIFISTPTLVVSASASYSFTIAKPNCNHTCGDITIPFPFGTTQDCSRSDGFWGWGMTCNYTTDPPKLFWTDTDIEITHISLDGQFKLLKPIAMDCYARNGSSTSYSIASLELTTHFTLNNTANKFTVVGCDAYGFVSGWRLDRNYTTGCTALCESEDELVEGSCDGVGCCQSPIPKNAWKVEVEAASFWNHTKVWDFNNCSYAFFAEVGAFNFSKDNLNSLYNGDQEFPM